MSQTTKDGTNDRNRELSENDRHRLLANEGCRLTLDALAAQSGPVSVSGLAESIAVRTDDVDESEVATTLHHVSLPMLADADVVDYDATEHHVEPRFELVDELTQ